MNKVLVDTSFLYALYDQTDPYHKKVSAAVTIYQHQMLIPYVVLTETAYLFKRNDGMRGLIQFINALTKANYQYEILIPKDFVRIHAILIQYADAKFDFVDCCLMALAERHQISTICTLDQRDFAIFRPDHIPQFDLLP